MACLRGVFCNVLYRNTLLLFLLRQQYRHWTIGVADAFVAVVVVPAPRPVAPVAIAHHQPNSMHRISSSSRSSSVQLYNSHNNDSDNDAINDDDANNNNANKKKKPVVAVVGSGAVGCFYGARLWETNEYIVKFHMRGEHFRASKQRGLSVTSIDGDVFIPPESLLAFEDTAEMGKADWVLVALKSSSLGAIPPLLLPLCKPTTRVLVVMNGLIEDDLLTMLHDYHATTTAVAASSTTTSSHNNNNNNNDETTQPASSTTITAAAPQQRQLLSCCGAVYGGMALLCSNRIGPGRIHHSYAGKLSGGVAASSYPSHDPKDPIHEREFHNLWRNANVETEFEPSLVKGRWKKNMWNLPFNTISVAMGGITVDKITKDPGLRDLALKIMDETIAIANADIAASSQDTAAGDFIDASYKDLMMDFTDVMGPYKTSTMLDLTNRRAMEVKYLFRKPLDRARELGIPAPHLETVVAQVEAFQRFYGLF